MKIPDNDDIKPWMIQGNELLNMPVFNQKDTQKFFLGVNNLASSISENGSLINMLGSANRLTISPTSDTLAGASLILAKSDNWDLTGASAISALHISSPTASYLLDGAGVTSLTRNMSEILAYGSAVENKPDYFTLLNTSVDSVRLWEPSASAVMIDPTASTYLEPDVSALFFNSPSHTYKPQHVKTVEVFKTAPAVKEILPTAKAGEIMEMVSNSSGAKDDEIVMTSVGEIKKAIKGVLHIVSAYSNSGEATEKIEVATESEKAKEIMVGYLLYRADGAVCFKGKPLEMRHQIKTLCIFFMERHKAVVECATIKNELIEASKRSYTSDATVQKYVSELHKILKGCFKEKVIFNHGNEGYIFEVKESS